MLEGWLGWLLRICWHTIHNIFIHFIITINKRIRVFIKHFNYCSWFFKEFFLAVSFVSWCAGWLISSFWVVGPECVNRTAVLAKTTQLWNLSMTGISCKNLLPKECRDKYSSFVEAIIKQENLFLTWRESPTVALSHQVKIRFINFRSNFCR